MKAKSILPSQLLICLFTALLMICQSQVRAQSSKGTIRGKVVTSQGKPADNVTIALKGTSYGTITNEQGIFVLRVPAGTYTLMVSHIGVTPLEKSVTVTAGKALTVETFTMSASNNDLAEVSVNGSKVNPFKKKESDIVAKMPLNDLENAQSYSVVTHELLTDQGINTADDAVRDEVGVQKMWDPTGRGGDGGSYYLMRGFIVQSQLRNGLAGNVTNVVDAANLDRIEVIKGPSATLFGSALTSYGGVMNRVTKQPYDQFGAQVNYTGGSYGYNRGALDLNTPLDAKKDVLFRLNTAYTDQGSFETSAFNKLFVVDPSIIYKVNDRLSFSADAELSYGRNAINSMYFFPYGQTIAQLGASNPNQLGFNYKESYFNSDLSQESRNTNFFGQMNYKLSDKWTSQTAFSSVNSFSNGFGPYFYLLPHDSISRNDQSTKNSKYGVTEIQENINGDFKIGGLRNRVVIGLDYFRINSQQYFYYGTYDTISLANPNLNYNTFNKANLNAARANGTAGNYLYSDIFKSNTYSAYVSDVLNITDRLIASAALRVDSYHNEGSYNPTGNTTSGAYHQTDFSPKFGLVYQLVKDEVSLYGNYQNGFTNENGVDANGNLFKPEQANQLEGGVKVDLFNGRLSSTLSYYDIKVKDILRTDPQNPLYQIQNGTQLSKGFEAEVIANPIDGLNVIVGFAYNDSRLVDADADVEGRRPSTAGSPYLANFWASYRLQQGVIKGLGLGFGGNYASNNKVVNSVSQGVFILPEYTIFNSSLFYDRRDYRIGLTVNNLFNKEYYTGYSTINPQMLRQFLASFTFRFQ